MQPILYSELVENEVSCFILLNNNILYKLVLRRKQLEKEEKKKINERNEYINSILEKFNWVSGIKNIFKKKKTNDNVDESINSNIINIDEVNSDENNTNIKE